MAKLHWTKEQSNYTSFLGLAFQVSVNWAIDGTGHNVNIGNKTFKRPFDSIEAAKRFAEQKAFETVYLMVSRVEDYKREREAQPAPRYDEVYFAGMEALDKM